MVAKRTYGSGEHVSCCGYVRQMGEDLLSSLRWPWIVPERQYPPSCEVDLAVHLPLLHLVTLQFLNCSCEISCQSRRCIQCPC